MAEYLKSLFGLENKVAVLTGGAGVLSGEMAKGLIRAGASVVLLDVHEKKLEERKLALGAENYKAECLTCNVLDEKHLVSIRDEIIERFGTLDILINAAGGNVPGATVGIDQTVFDLPTDQLRTVTDLNFWGTVLPTLTFGKIMAAQKSGSIINISSMASLRSISRVVGYSAAKAAVDNFTRWMAVELAQKFGGGIRVNAIAPGFLITDQNRALLTDRDGSLTERGKAVIGMTPFRRFGLPAELVGTILWLSGNASQFVTGAVIPIDGGFSINSGV